jgi:membrane protein DedA with SNARE-associated domain
MSESLEFLVRHGYAVVFGFVLAEQIGLPIPAIPVLLAAGALAGAGKLNLVVALVVATLASLLADIVWYLIGRLRGARVLNLLCRISLEPDSCVRRTENIFVRHGARSLLVAKFVPGFSTVAPPLAGIIGMGLVRFAVFTGLGGALWAGAFIGLGFVFSNQLEEVAAIAEQLGTRVLVLGVAALAAYIGWKWVARQRFLRRIRIARISPEDLKAKLDAGEAMVLVDVRAALDFEAEPSVIPGALHLTTEELEARHHEIPRDREIVLYCT